MTNRRDFLKQSSILASATVLNPSFLWKEKFKLGLQLFTIRDAMAQDVKGTIQKLAAMGYQEVEIYGFSNKQYYGMPPADFKKILEDNGITSSSGHYDLDKFLLANKTTDDLKRYVDECIEGAHILKQEYIVWPWLDPSLRTIDKFKLVAETLNRIGEQIKKGGLQLGYHNHDFEFKDWNGKKGYDIILNDTDASLVKLELDLYWATRSGQQPHDLFAQQPGRFVIWHVKDMDKTDHDLHTTVGDGTIDFKTIWKDTALAGVKHIFVEQGNNYVPDALQCVSRSAAYMKANIL